MQATLLGLSVAIILALVAALVGPHFVDWTQYRATFENEATRIVGLPVRIAGPIDVRLLPTPTVTLGQVELGDVPQPQTKVREIYAELSLGSLMRGAVRASELRVTGPDASLNVSGNGRVEWPAVRLGFDPDQFVIDKVTIEDARLSLHDGASDATLALEGLWFNGDLRSLVGPARGEGGFTAAGERYGYRLSANRLGEDGSLKVRLGLDPSDHPFAIEADGAIRVESGSPRFDGTLTLSRLAAMAGSNGRGSVAVPWRASAKVKAAPDHALFEQLEYTYGPDDRALKLAGTANFHLGNAPHFETVLSARQADLDRALALPEASRRLPLIALKSFVAPFASSYRPSFPVRIGIAVDAVTLATGTLQNVRGDLAFDTDGWNIETLEFRAPGFAQVRVGGRLSATGQDVNFKGPAQIEASDPKLFLAWLEGRDTTQRQSGQLRASGDLTIGAQAFAVDRMKFEFDRKTIEGRIAYGAGGARPRLDADLKAGDLDVDGVMAFGRAALEGSAVERPRDIALKVDIGRANVAGVDVKGVSGTFKLDPAGITFDQVHIGDLGDASFNLNGRMEGALDAPRGTVTFDVDARGLDGTAAVLAKYWPEAAGVVRHAAARIVPLKTHATLGVEPVSSTDPGGPSKVKLVLDGTGGALRMKFDGEAAGDVATLTMPEYRLDANLAATDGTVLTALLGLDRIINVDKRAGALSLTVRGRSGSDAEVNARATAGGLVSTVKGTTRLFSKQGFAAGLDVTLSAADVSPIRRGAASRATALLPLALRARLDAHADDLAFDRISGIVGNAQVRGKLKVALGSPRRIEGQIDADSADVAALVAVAFGMPKAARDDAAWSADPFSDSVLDGFAGHIAFSTGRAVLTPTLNGRDARASLEFDDREVAIKDVEVTLPGGRASGQLVLRRGTEGVSAGATVALSNVDASALLPGEGKPPVTGRLNLQAQVEGSGLSPASLIGSLNGAGTITLEDAQFAGLDPKAFSAAIRAMDQGVSIDAPRVHDIVAVVLDGGPIAVPRLDAAVTFNAGQAHVAPFSVLGQGADLTISGSADLAEATIDARLSLLGPTISEGANSIRPEILLSVKGPYAAPKRTVDASALSGWLMLRSVDRQAKQISTIEAERREMERREAEKREAEKREAEKREAEKRDAEKRDAEKREAVRRAAEDKATTSTIPAALPVPQIMEEPPPESAPPPARAAQPRPARAPAAEQPPALPPPMNIGPAPGAAKPARPRTGGAAQTPPPPRSALEALFGVR